MSYQKIILEGFSGKDAELRYTADGIAVASFSMAVDEGFVDNKTTQWYRITCWRKTAEVAAEYVKKGKNVLVEGRLQGDKSTGGPRVYQRNDGTFGAGFEVTCDRLVLIGGGAAREQPANDGGHGEDESEIPF